MPTVTPGCSLLGFATLLDLPRSWNHPPTQVSAVQASELALSLSSALGNDLGKAGIWEIDGTVEDQPGLAPRNS